MLVNERRAKIGLRKTYLLPLRGRSKLVLDGVQEAAESEVDGGFEQLRSKLL